MEIKKPLTVAREEFLEGLVKFINESEIPAFVAESILKEITAEVHSAMQEQYKADKKAYEEALASQEEQK